MTKNYRVWLMRYEGLTPLAWENNPNEGLITREITEEIVKEFQRELTLELANAVAQGFNEEEIKSPIKLNEWAVILKDDTELEIGQSIRINNFTSYN